MIAVLTRLAAAGVTLFIKAGRLRFQGNDGAYTPELRAQVDANRLALITALTIPTDCRARAAWLGSMAQLSGFDAQRLFDLIDATFGPRVLGAYELDAAETEQIAAVLRTEIGKRSPIMPPAECTADPVVNDTLPASIKRKNDLGMTDERFAELCRRVLGRPGLRSAEDDAAVFAAMPRRTHS